MKFHFVAVPVFGSSAGQEELNHFLASHRVVSVDRQLIGDGTRSAWAVCVAYDDAELAGAEAARKPRVDYKEVLSDEEFAVFAKLRDLRKQWADREGVPPYQRGPQTYGSPLSALPRALSPVPGARAQTTSSVLENC